jgi:hypothetical protein
MRGGFAALHEKFASWLPVSNRNGCLGLALTLLYVVAEVSYGRRRNDGEIDQPTWWPAMSLCALCAQPTLDGDDVCVFHLCGHGDEWATGNRIMCDFVHRGIVPPAPCERVDALEPLVGIIDAYEVATP